ncbi:MAG: type III-A CRISPR-associated RAMP protein Csm5 [Thermodesulforhabdaceae bacterium]|jgi:CRISPR-associated protein Csm5
MRVLETSRCIIKVLTPLHVGCGEAYEPYSFFVDQPKKELVVLNMDAFLTALDARTRDEFSRICQEGTVDSLLKMYKFLKRIGERKDIVGKEGVVARRIPVATGFVEHYGEVTGGQQFDPRRSTHRQPQQGSNRIITQFIVYRTAFDVNGKEHPIIPGSSVKGSIRTAVLNMRKDVVKGKRYLKNENKKLEADILHGSFSTDPFSLVKVSDFVPLGEPKVKIVYGVNVKKGSDRQSRGPYQILEVVLEGEFSGTISLLEPEKDRGIEAPLSLDEIKRALQEFYGKELEREKGELSQIGFNINLPSSSPIRIGRHSGAECVTIEGFRKIKIMRGSPPERDHATTIWVASEERRSNKLTGCLPFGWCEFQME